MCFYLLVFAFAICSSRAAISVEEYCSTWFPDDIDTCLSKSYAVCVARLMRCRSASSAFETNSAVVSNRRQSGDLSASESYYLNVDKSEYESTMLLSHHHSLLLPPLNMNDLMKYSCNVFPVNPVVSRSYPELDFSLSSSLFSYKSYILQGLLDAMFMSFKDSLPSFSSILSLTMLENAVGKSANVTTALLYLKEFGVCSEADYAQEVERGFAKSPHCYRVRRLRVLSLLVQALQLHAQQRE